MKQINFFQHFEVSMTTKGELGFVALSTEAKTILKGVFGCGARSFTVELGRGQEAYDKMMLLLERTINEGTN